MASLDDILNSDFLKMKIDWSAEVEAEYKRKDEEEREVETLPQPARRGILQIPSGQQKQQPQASAPAPAPAPSQRPPPPSDTRRGTANPGSRRSQRPPLAPDTFAQPRPLMHNPVPEPRHAPPSNHPHPPEAAASSSSRRLPGYEVPPRLARAHHPQAQAHHEPEPTQHPQQRRGGGDRPRPLMREPVAPPAPAPPGPAPAPGPRREASVEGDWELDEVVAQLVAIGAELEVAHKEATQFGDFAVDRITCLRHNLLTKYRETLVKNIQFSFTKNLENMMWKSGFYNTIEVIDTSFLARYV